MTDSNKSSTPEPTWSAETRNWVSLLLFAHLFAVVIAVTSYTQPSVLQERIHTLFEPYLRNLHLTALPASYPFARFHLTHAGETDVDFSIEVDAEHPDGTTETVTLPDESMQPLVRYRRYQSLANAAGTLASGELGEGVTGILPKTIAGSVLRSEGSEGGAIRIQALGLPNLETMSSLAEVARAAHEDVSNVYDAQVIVSPGSVELLRKSTTLEVAPVQPGGAVAPSAAPGTP